MEDTEKVAEFVADKTLIIMRWVRELKRNYIRTGGSKIMDLDEESRDVRARRKRQICSS